MRNSGEATLNYTISHNATWLSVDPSTGSSTGEADTITVSYATANLPAGVFSATITVSDATATNNPQTISVTLTVSGEPGCVDLGLENGDFEDGSASWSGDCTDSSTIWNPGGAKQGSKWGSVQEGGARDPKFAWQTVAADSIPTQLTGYMADGTHAYHDHVVQLIDGDENGVVLAEFRQTNGPGESHSWRSIGTLTGTPTSGYVTVKFGWINNSGSWSDGTATHVDDLQLVQCSPALPVITLSTSVLNPVTEQYSSPPADTFTVENSGEGTLNYSISD
ncbi:MAG: hypothetical protein GTO22_21615, partial [Gemmatimonadales bacterium]|nr:hypothetical protein [Gemmatimonadales bacterium]